MQTKTESPRHVGSSAWLGILRVASPATLAGLIADVDMLGNGADREVLAIRAAAEKELRENVGDAEADCMMAATPERK
jgi:hypothetical protein